MAHILNVATMKVWCGKAHEPHPGDEPCPACVLARDQWILNNRPAPGEP